MKNKERPEVIDALLSYVNPKEWCVIEKFQEDTGFRGFRIFSEEFVVWMNSEYIEPFKITKTEKEYLEILQVALGVSEIKKRKGLLILTIGKLSITRSQQVDLFPSLEEEKCFKINDILENYEVIDNETNDL